MEKQGLIKKLIADDRSKKSKKKSHAGQILYKQGVPARCRGGGRGGRGGRGRLGVRGTPKL